MSQQRLATKADVAIGTVRSLENGRSVDPSFFTILALADALGVQLVDLINEIRPQGGGES